MCNLSIFFYDELNRDYSPLNAARIGEAMVCGKLYLLPPNSPVLQTPTNSILWRGTKEIFADAQNQYMENDGGDFEFKIHAGWDVVHGELVMFSDPEDIVPELDKLYGRPFYFDRVLVPVKKADGTITTAYVYTMDKIHMSARYLPDGIWVGATDSENNKKGAWKMGVNQNTIKKFKRLFEIEMKAHDKYSAALNVGFAGYSDAQEKAFQDKSNVASERIFSEFKKHEFTEAEWDELLSDCGYFDCGWDYEDMIESNKSK